MSIRAVILVHGYFLDGHAWRKIIPLLAERGIEATAVQLSLNSLSEDAAIVERAIAMHDGPVLLVGHSYGGAVVTLAGNDPRVAALVYVAGAAPDNGQSVNDWWRDYATAAVAQELRPYGNTHTMITRHGVHEYLGQDLSVEEADLVHATQGPFGPGTVDQVIATSAWHDKPSWYLVTTRDHTVPPALQQDTAERMGAEILVLETSHLPMLSQPEKVAAFIANAAASFDG